MDRNKKLKSFREIYNEANQRPANADKIELITDLVEKLKSIIVQSNFLIDTLEQETKN